MRGRTASESSEPEFVTLTPSAQHRMRSSSTSPDTPVIDELYASDVESLKVHDTPCCYEYSDLRGEWTHVVM